MTGCGAARKRAQEALDRREDPRCDQGVAAHLRQCPSCDRYVADLSRLARAANRRSTSPLPAPTDSISERVLAHVASRAPARRGAPLHRPAWQSGLAFGGAFALVLLAGIQIGSWRAEQRPASLTSAAAPLAAPQSTAAMLPDPSLVAAGGSESSAAAETAEVTQPIEAAEPVAPPTVTPKAQPHPGARSSRRAPIIPKGRSRVERQPERSTPAELQVVDSSRGGALSPMPAGMEMPGISGPVAHSSRIVVPTDAVRQSANGGASAPVEIIAVSPGSGL